MKNRRCYKIFTIYSTLFSIVYLLITSIIGIITTINITYITRNIGLHYTYVKHVLKYYDVLNYY